MDDFIDFMPLIISLLIMLIGLISMIFTFSIGASLILIGMVVYGFLVGFEPFSIWFWIGQIVLLVTIFVIEYVASIINIKYHKGSNLSIIGCIIGCIIGLFTLNIFGVLLGAIFGAIAGEMVNKKPLNQAIKIGMCAAVGFIIGWILQTVIGIVMIAWFLFVIF
ncbi:MAG: DUF456 domain-containing protein [Methanosarcinaceae archaeon]|nr:DUF456 domain-containing protein [Methanosarcinaceae archaeon]NKQ39629.1 DUF456 domain-containing protein [Methanosarcinales archaeon]